MQRHIPQLEVHPAYGKAVAEAHFLKKLRHKIIPRHTYLPFRHELRMAWLRIRTWRVPERYRDARNLLVNVGAGKKGKSGWINVDIKEEPEINCVYDCRKRLPFPDNSVRGIFCEHFLEHIDYTEEAPYFVAECHRVLQSGGVLRIAVPDLEKYLRAYCSGGWTDLAVVRGLDPNHRDPYFKCNYLTRMELINVLFRQGFEHKYAYDGETLSRILSRHGFGAVKRQEFGQSQMKELCIDDPERVSESLYIEAVK